MPSKYRIEVEIEEPMAVEPQHLHANVCRWLEISEAEHNSNHKPFSISPLFPLDHQTGPNRWGFEIGLLDDQLGHRLEASLKTQHHHPIRLGPVQALLAPGASCSLVHQTSWRNLVELSQQTDISTWTMHAKTPMLFRQGNRDLPFPLVGSIIRSLERSWSHWSPTDVDGSPWNQDRALGRVKEPARADISHFSGQSYPIKVKRRHRIGYVGTISIATPRRSPLHSRQHLDTILRLSPYCGVGSMTTYGLGVVEIIEHNQKPD